MATDGEVGRTRANKRQKRRINEKSRIFFVVDEDSNEAEPNCKVWYQIDVNDLGCGAQRLEKQAPFLIGSAVGSCDSFLYSLCGYTCTYSEWGLPKHQKAVTNTYFYDTTKPGEWFAGPHMKSPRVNPSHQVIGSKIYVLGGAYISSDYYENDWDFPHLVWGEYLDVSLPVGEWEWIEVKIRHGEGGFTCSGRVDDVDYISSLPLFKGGFHPERHILCRCDTRNSCFLCYNVVDRSLCKVFECDFMFSFRPVMNVYVEGDYIVAPDSARVLVIGTFSESSSSSSPWFVGDIQSAENHFPPMPTDMHSWIFRNPGAFALVRIAPHRYASLWFPEPDKPYVSLSVFTICPPPTPPGSVDLDSLDLLFLDRVPATFEVEHVRIPLQPDYPRMGPFRIIGAVAM